MDEVVKIMFEKDTCKMVQRALVLMSRVHIITLYNILGITIINGCNRSMVLESGV